MISDAEQRRIWGGGTAPSWQLGIGAALLVAVFAAALLPARGIDPTAARWRKAFAAAAAILAGIMLASRLHVSEHHLVAVLPLAAGALAILAVEVGRAFRPAVPGLAVLAACLAALFLGWDVRIDPGSAADRRTESLLERAFRSGRASRGTSRSPERLKILDWGLLNNLYVASGGAVFRDRALLGGHPARRSRRGSTWDAEIRDGGTFLLFRFPQASSPLSAASEGFSEALGRFDGPRRETVFSDRSGSPVAALVEINPAKLDGR